MTEGTGMEPATPGSAFVIGLAVAHVAVFVAMAPLLGMLVPLKAQAIDPANKEPLLSAALSWGAVTAGVANVLAGVLSDRTRSRFGRRRPWMVGGIVGVLASYLVIATAETGLILIWGVILFQAAYNALLAALLALFADRAAGAARARLSAVMGLSYPVGNMIGAALVGGWLSDTGERFGLLAGILVVGALPFAILARDQPLINLDEADRAGAGSVSRLGPLADRVFILAWIGRALMTTSFVVGSIYLLYFVAADTDFQKRYGASPEAGLAVLTTAAFVAVLAAALLIGALGPGARARRGLAVVGAAVLSISGLGLAWASGWTWVVAAFVLHGLGTGVYYAVEMGVMADVLPDRGRKGRDLGLINLAAALPQAWAPLVALGGLRLFDAGYRPVLTISALGFLAGAAAFAALRRGR